MRFQEPETVNAESQIQFSQVAGLWIVLGVAVLAAAALAAAYAAHLRWSRRHVVAAGAALTRGAKTLARSATAPRSAGGGGLSRRGTGGGGKADLT